MMKFFLFIVGIKKIKTKKILDYSMVLYLAIKSNITLQNLLVNQLPNKFSKISINIGQVLTMN